MTTDGITDSANQSCADENTPTNQINENAVISPMEEKSPKSDNEQRDKSAIDKLMDKMKLESATSQMGPNGDHSKSTDNAKQEVESSKQEEDKNPQEVGHESLTHSLPPLSDGSLSVSPATPQFLQITYSDEKLVS